MKKTYNNCIILFLMLSLATACKKENTNSNLILQNCTNNSGWVKNDHEWVYTNDPILFFADSLFVKTEETSSGIFKITSTFDDGFIYPVTSVYLQPCGNIIYQSVLSTMTNPQEVYHIDGDIGDTWTNTVISTGGHTITNTNVIIAKNVSITVPAGTFSCLHFRITSVSSEPTHDTVISDVYMNNEYGMIKTDGTTTYYELARKNF